MTFVQSPETRLLSADKRDNSKGVLFVFLFVKPDKLFVWNDYFPILSNLPKNNHRFLQCFAVFKPFLAAANVALSFSHSSANNSMEMEKKRKAIVLSKDTFRQHVDVEPFAMRNQ